MLAANRSYHVRISYLPAAPDQVAAAGKVCTAGCNLCRLGQEHVRLQKAFREVSSRSLARRWAQAAGRRMSAVSSPGAGLPHSCG